MTVPEDRRVIDKKETPQVSVPSASVEPVLARQPIGAKASLAAKRQSRPFENQRDLLRCLCKRHNIGGYTPTEFQRLDKIDHDFYIKFRRDGSRAINSKPNLVGPCGFILANEDDSFRVCVTSNWPWTKYDLPKVTRCEGEKPGMIRFSRTGAKKQSPPHRFQFIEGGDPKRELEALKAIGLRPLGITAKDIHKKWRGKMMQELHDSVAPYKDSFSIG